MVSDSIRLETSTSDISGVRVVKVAGEIDIYTVADFKSALYGAISSGEKLVVIDLSNVGYMDSSGFGTLLGATKTLRPRGGSIKLAGCSEAIERMLRITRLDTIFETFPDVSNALSAAETT